MRHIENLRGVSQDDADKLKAKGIVTLDDLWRCVGVNFDEGVSRVAAEARVAPALLFSLLIAASFGEIRHAVEGKPFNLWDAPKLLWIRARRFWRSRGRRWGEALLAVGTLILAVIAIRSGYASPETLDQVVVAQGAGLLPFQPIRAENVTLKRTPKELKSFAALNDVIGHYPLRAIAPGTTLKDEHLLPSNMSAAMTKRRVLSIAVNPKSLGRGPHPPSRVWMLLSPRATGEKSPPPVLLNDVILLSVNQEAEKSFIEVAVTEDGLNAVSPLLGAAEVFIIKPIE